MSASIECSQNDSPDSQLHSLPLDLHKGWGTKTDKTEREGEWLGQTNATLRINTKGKNKRIKKKKRRNEIKFSKNVGHAVTAASMTLHLYGIKERQS